MEVSSQATSALPPAGESEFPNGGRAGRCNGRDAHGALPERRAQSVRGARASSQPPNLQLRAASTSHAFACGGRDPGRVHALGAKRRRVQTRSSVLDLAVHHRGNLRIDQLRKLSHRRHASLDQRAGNQPDAQLLGERFRIRVPFERGAQRALVGSAVLDRASRRLVAGRSTRGVPAARGRELALPRHRRDHRRRREYREESNALCARPIEGRPERFPRSTPARCARRFFRHLSWIARSSTESCSTCSTTSWTS